MKKVSDLTVEEFKDLIKNTIKEELSIVQINQTCPPYPLPIRYQDSKWLNNPVCVDNQKEIM